MIDTLNDRAAALLSLAVQTGIVDTPLTPWYQHSIPDDMFGHVLDRSAICPQNQHEFELYQHPRSQRLQEHVFGPATDPDVALNWAVELARITVPDGEIGILKSIEQALHDTNGDYYPTNQFYWGSPYFVIDDVSNCRWYLTLEPFYGTQPAQYNATSAAAIPITALPGTPYSELSEIDGIWYPAHAGVSDNLKYIIPGRTMLRFFFVTPPTVTYEWVAAGRLRAYTQTTYCPEAAQNTRLYW